MIKFKSFAKIIVAVSILQQSELFAADRVFVNFGGVSHHEHKHSDNGVKYNNINLGFGVDVERNDFVYSIGMYQNSESKQSTYASVSYHPIKVFGASMGVSAGLASGYARNPIVPMALFSACWDSVCIVATPTISIGGEKTSGVISLRFRTKA